MYVCNAGVVRAQVTVTGLPEGSGFGCFKRNEQFTCVSESSRDRLRNYFCSSLVRVVLVRLAVFVASSKKIAGCHRVV